MFLSSRQGSREIESVKLLATDSELSWEKITARIVQLREFVEVVQQIVPQPSLLRAMQDLTQVEQRIALGKDFTVAALLGGTGAGKSTLFNALTGFNFADAGEVRPTTELVTACTWRAQAQDLLDYLNVLPSRRIEHDSILTPVPNDLAGLVLLDLPDYDSVKFGNSLTVTALLPMVDLLIWVVEPQKYADQLLHQSYLEKLQGRAASLMVVLNQADTVSIAGQEVLLADLRRLLDRDGLSQVPIYVTSALHGSGIPELTAALEQQVGNKDILLNMVATELDTIALRLANSVGILEADLDADLRAVLIEKVMVASGVPALSEAIMQGAGKVRRVAFTRPVQPGSSVLEAVRNTWVEQATLGLRGKWDLDVRSLIAPAETVHQRLGAIYAQLPLPVLSSGALRFAYVGAFFLSVLGLLGITGAMLGVPSVFLDWFKMIWSVSLGGSAPKWGIGVVGAFCVMLAVGWILGAKIRVKARGRRLAESYVQHLTQEVEVVLEELWIKDVALYLEQHKKARKLLTGR